MAAPVQYAPKVEGVDVKFDFVKSKRGADLFTATITRTGAEPTAYLIFHHGLADHCQRHIKVLQRVVKETGIMVITFDAHGHGKSGPFVDKYRVFINRFQDLVDDFLEITNTQLPPSAGKKMIFAGGYSVGALVATHAVAQNPVFFSGLLITSMLVDLTWGMNPLIAYVKYTILQVMNLFVPFRRQFPRRPFNLGCRSPEGIQELENDPLWFNNNFPVRTIASVIHGCSYAARFVSTIQVPVLATHGTDDKSCSIEALKYVLKELTTKDLYVNEVKGGYHDLHHDPDTDKVAKVYIKWLKGHVHKVSAT